MNILAAILVVLGCGAFLAEALLCETGLRTWGHLTQRYGERRLKYGVLHKDGSIISFGSVSEEISFPARGESNYRNITMISVTDQLNDSKRRQAVITKGGVGFPYVTMQFRGPRGKGYSFIYEILG